MPFSTAQNTQVIGPDAAGVAVAGKPVLSAGTDGTNVRTLRLDTTGREPATQFYQWISSATSVNAAKSGAGILRRIIVGCSGASSINAVDTLTIGSGTVITSLTVPAGASPNSIEINLPFTTGISFQTTGTGVSFTPCWD